MNKRIMIAVLILIGVLFISTNAFSAWTQPKGHSYNQLTFSHYVTNEKFTTIETDKEGVILDTDAGIREKEQPEFVSQKVTYYGEYGITDKLTVFLAVPYDWQESDDTIKFAGDAGPAGIGDINLGLRHGLAGNVFNTGILASIQAEVKVPEAYKYKHPLTHLNLGDGQYDATIALLLGKGYNKGYAWANIGYKFRFENDEFDPQTFDPSDQFKVSFGGGYPVTSWLSIRGIFSYTKSIGNASVSDELIRENFKYGGIAEHGDTVLIKDSLGLEPDALSAGVDLAFNFTPKTQAVISYNRDFQDLFGLKSKDWSLGQTFSIAFVYMH
jgi:hypothetical protein